jgi:serine/threonine-protein kinase
MGEVYRATDLRLGRTVALKLVAPERVDEPTMRERFLAESRIAASLDHPHIVPIYEAGEADGRLFLAMRFVEGDDLGVLIDQDGPLDPDRALRLLGGVARALDAAHAGGLIHRDVKPSNILVTPTVGGEEHAYLADFGLVKRLDTDAAYSMSGQILGSADYAAPEQIEGRPVGAAADVYSLACVVYACLTGQPPYPRDSEIATLWAHVSGDVPSISELHPQLAALDPVIRRGMAKDPLDRQPTASALIAEATAALSATKHRALGPGSPPKRRQPDALSTVREFGRRRPATALILVGIGAVGLGLAAAGLGASGSGGPSSPTPPSASVRGTQPSVVAVAPTELVDRIIFSLQRDFPRGWRQTTSCADGDVQIDAKLAVIDPSGSNGSWYRLSSQTNLFEQTPSWSADGGTIAFTGDIQNSLPGIFTIKPDGSTLNEVAAGNPWIYQRTGLEPRVSPDGSKVIWLTGEGLTVASADGSHIERVLGRHPEDPPPADREAFEAPLAADWMPDGRLLVASGTTDEGGSWVPGLPIRLETMDATGAGRAALTIDIDAAPSKLAVSPDGTQAAYLVATERIDQPPSNQLYVVDLADGTRRAVGEADVTHNRPAWSPDGRSIAVAGSDGQLWRVDIASAAAERLTALDGAIACSPAWGRMGGTTGPLPTLEPGAPRPLERGLAPPSEYLADLHRPMIKFKLSEAWRIRRNYPDGLAMAPFTETELGELDTGRIQVGLTGPCFDSEEVVIGTKPKDVIDWVSNRTDLEVSDPSAINLGGYTGIAIDISGPAGEGCEGTNVHNLYRSGEDISWLGDGETLRLMVIDVRGDTVAFEMYALPGQKERLVELAEPVLASVSFP